MSGTLQIALFFASLAVVLLAACAIPLAFQAKRQFDVLVVSVADLKAQLEALVHESRQVVRNVNNLAAWAGRQTDEVNQVVRTVRDWTARVDRLVDGVGSVVEPPVFSLARNAAALRKGWGAFVQSFFHRQGPQGNGQASATRAEKEADHGE